MALQNSSLHAIHYTPLIQSLYNFGVVNLYTHLHDAA